MDTKVIKLLPHEANVKAAEMQGGLMLASLYEQTDRIRATCGLSDLKNRMESILKANTWLMSRARKFKDKKDTYVQLELDSTMQNVDDYIQIVIDDEVFDAYDTKSNSKINEVLWKYACKPGKDLIGMSGNSKKPGLKMTNFAIIQNVAETKLVVLLCVSHAIVDGATQYNIWKMLDVCEAVRSLDREPVESFDNKVRSNLSVLSSKNGTMRTVKEELDKDLKTLIPALLMNGIGNMVTRVKHATYTFKLNKDYIASEKAKYTNSTKFVSTNDVITSWFMNALGPKSDNMLMAVNLRNRVPEFADNLAGNYIATPTFKRTHVQTPPVVREHLNKTLNPNFHYESATYSELRKFGGVVNSSWVRFYHHVQPAGFEQKLHMPVIRDLGVRMGPIFLCTAGVMVIYVSNKDELAALFILNDDSIDQTSFENEEMLGELLIGP